MVTDPSTTSAAGGIYSIVLQEGYILPYQGSEAACLGATRW
jgi:hypothetical protein